MVPVAAPVMAAGRWELDGEPVASAELTRRDPPGFGDCITADDVGDFDDGAYQYIAIGESGATSAVATLVVGVPSVAVWLLNNGDEPVCLVQASPRDADFYEAYQPDSELLPGEALAIRCRRRRTGRACVRLPPGRRDTQPRPRAAGRRVR